MVLVRSVAALEFACRSSACRPPTSGGTGGSSGKPIPPPPGYGYGPKALPDVRLGSVRVTYSPDYPDDGPDPGEIVWARVPFEDDPKQSKDRPVLVLGRIEGTDKLAAVQLTTQVRAGKDQLPVGKLPGQDKQSAVKLNRIIQVDASNYRREGSVVSKPAFEKVVGHVAAYHRTPVEIS